MRSKKFAVVPVVLLAAGLTAACNGSKATEDSPVAFHQITGDQFTANPGAVQTDGVAVPPQRVTMVGDPVAAQAVANAGLPQGTITASANNMTVYYPPMPAMQVEGLAATPARVTPPPMERPADYRPWSYSEQQLRIYRAICDTGRWASFVAGVEQQSQVCWGLYGRQLGVRPWTPDQPRPWTRPGYPKSYFDPGFRADTPVMWVYPRGWDKPKPQPLITVSITLNVPGNPYHHPKVKETYYPVWRVVPGTVIDQRQQEQRPAPVYTVTTTTTTTTTTTSIAPIAPGVSLPPMPVSNTVKEVLAVPGDRAFGNPNTRAAVTQPAVAALQGAPIQAGSITSLDEAVGTSVAASVVSTATTTDATAGTTTTVVTRRGFGLPTPDAGTTTTTTTGADGTTTTTTTSTTTSLTSTTTSEITTTTTTTTVPQVTTTVPQVTTTVPQVTTTVPQVTTTVPQVTTTVPQVTTTVPEVTTTVPEVTTTVPKVTTTVPEVTTTVPQVTTTTAVSPR